MTNWKTIQVCGTWGLKQTLISQDLDIQKSRYRLKGRFKSNVRLVDQSSLKIGLSILSKLIRHLDGGLQYSANCFSRSASFALGHFCCFGWPSKPIHPLEKVFLHFIVVCFKTNCFSVKSLQLILIKLWIDWPLTYTFVEPFFILIFKIII